MTKGIFLIIEGTDLTTNEKVVRPILTSNIFMLGLKYERMALRNIFIDGWEMITKENGIVVSESGNDHPINSGAYLNEFLEDLTGRKL